MTKHESGIGLGGTTSQHMPELTEDVSQNLASRQSAMQEAKTTTTTTATTTATTITTTSPWLTTADLALTSCQVGNGKGGGSNAARILGETCNVRIKGCSPSTL